MIASSIDRLHDGDWWLHNSIRARMEKTHCHPGWFCQRCLAYPIAGTLSKCQSVCPKCFHQLLQSTRDIPLPTLPVKLIPDRVIGVSHGDMAGKVPARRTIPRIIHTIGSFQDQPTMLTHPDWIRVQNSWQSQQGYEYHAYATIGQQRRWLERNYPHIFLSAFDCLNEDPRQQHFFALLLLYRKGGITTYSKCGHFVLVR